MPHPEVLTASSCSPGCFALRSWIPRPEVLSASHGGLSECAAYVDFAWDWFIINIADVHLDHPDPIDPRIQRAEDFLTILVPPANVSKMVLLAAASTHLPECRASFLLIACVSSSTTRGAGSGVILELPLSLLLRIRAFGFLVDSVD